MYLESPPPPPLSLSPLTFLSVTLLCHTVLRHVIFIVSHLLQIIAIANILPSTEKQTNKNNDHRSA